MASTYETRLFINGEFREPTGERTWELINPATEELICEIREASNEDVDAAVRAAHDAFPSWSLDIGGRRRGELLIKLADLLQQEKEFIANIECINVGKPIQYAREDMDACISTLRYYGGWADKIRGGSYLSTFYSNTINCHTRKEPVGVVAAIVPWNFPLMLTVTKAAAAMACGCTIVVKTSEKSPLSALALCKLVQQAGFPKGVINIINGYGDPVGVSLIIHPLVRKVSFTGSSSVGKEVAKKCSFYIKRITLELGGKSPLIVLNDANIHKAAICTWKGLFTNSGQCCVACSRVLVQSGVYNEYIKELINIIKKEANLSSPLLPCCTQGPIVDKKQLNKIIHYIQEGKKEGANCVLGGIKREGKGYWVMPTIFTDVTDEMKISKEEIFGPVVCLYKFHTIQEAIDRANDTEYGLGAGVFTSSIPLAEHFVSRLHAGTVWVNTYLTSDVGIPFGGYKASGYGREGGEEGLAPYLETKTVVTNIEMEEENAKP